MRAWNMEKPLPPRMEGRGAVLGKVIEYPSKWDNDIDTGRSFR